jgi:hypothetical protein
MVSSAAHWGMVPIWIRNITSSAPAEVRDLALFRAALDGCAVDRTLLRGGLGAGRSNCR